VTDQVDTAIAATEPGRTPGTSLSVTLSTGRKVGVVVPLDLTIAEALDLVGFVSSGLGPELARRKAARSPIQIARVLPQA
jgi:hypothetical protein